MPKDKSFLHIFTSYYLIVTFVTIILFIFFTLKIVNMVFTYYSDTIHSDTRNVLLDKVKTHYSINRSWDDFDGKDMGDDALLSGDYFTLESSFGEIIYSTEDADKRCCNDTNHKYVSVKEIINVGGEFVGIITVGYFSGHITSRAEEALQKNGLSGIILTIIMLNGISAGLTLILIYRLLKPLKPIVSTAEAMSIGDFRKRINIKNTTREIGVIANSINSLGDSLLKQETFRRDLTTILSHELRTPLHILLGQSEALLDGIYEPNTERLQAMRTEIKRVVTLLDELEDKLLYYAENFAVVVENGCLSEVVEKICIGYEGAFLKKNLFFNKDIVKDIYISFDKMRFSQMLVNLLSNALKYTKTGGVSLSLKRSNDKTILKVKDSGQGIDDEYKQLIFECFYHTNTYPGSKGIGLYIVKLVIEKHGWNININSKINEGTEIEIIM